MTEPNIQDVGENNIMETDSINIGASHERAMELGDHRVNTTEIENRQLTPTIEENELCDLDTEPILLDEEASLVKNMEECMQEATQEQSIQNAGENCRNSYEQSYFQQGQIQEIGRCSWDKATKHNYVRGCLWSPDGTCVLTAVHNDGMQVFELPQDIYGAQEVSSARSVNLMEPAVHVPQTTLVYDYKWYPGMDSSVPGTSVWIASRQHEPIQLWDAYTGELRCSYKGYNNVDEVESALSLTWSIDGEHIYGGYKKSIKKFDVKTPGREICTYPTKVTASCMTICTPFPNMVLFGSWSRTITALITDSKETIQVGNSSRGQGHGAGITWLKFIPRTNLFVSGGRKDSKLIIWDIRDLTKPYHVLQRTCDTNQRIYFDSSPYGEWIISGNTDGIVRAWNLLDIDEDRKSYRQHAFPLHRDCCNGVSFHPSKPVIATTSGQFHAEKINDDDELEISFINEQENSLTLWWIGKSTNGLSEE
ncbi:telomerase Cajal body protein 1 homolog [Uranotaenia lowii]|uniref:telomerase Cajal body protein 1 homolog n=1 Tax=Uranotaenia lowii TaxID=190385 RepID=UPI0024795C3C|nr:telomerase Cajal body protein 1 homolog [Uranotaenia lowii]